MEGFRSVVGSSWLVVDGTYGLGGAAEVLPDCLRLTSAATAKALWRDKLAGQVGAASKMPALPEA